MTLLPSHQNIATIRKCSFSYLFRMRYRRIQRKIIAGCIRHMIQNTILNVYTFIAYDKIEQKTKTDIRRTKHTERNMTRNLIILFRQTIEYFKCIFQGIF